MAAVRIAPETTEESLIWYTMVGTYGFYLIGALYVVVPVMAWVLFAYGLCRFAWDVKDEREAHIPLLPPSVWAWIVGMLVMLLALVVGHINYDIGLGGTIKSIIGWAKGWALLAIFPIIGCLKVRPEIIYRGACIVCGHTLLLLPVFVGAWAVGAPQTVYVSPLKAVGGPGPEFFALNLYELEPGSGAPRWRFFTPWAPAIGFVANLYFIFALQEKDVRWRWIGVIGCILMILMSKSRLALVSLATVWMVTWSLSHAGRPLLMFAAGVGTTLVGLVAVSIMQLVDSAVTAFRGARAGSSRVRSALARIAIDRWQREAPIWGHGVVERGPHMVEYMPIGSHHTWYGLLFVKGIVGFLAMAIPMLWSFFALWRGAIYCAEARVGLSVVLILFLYTFGENLEILPYLTWPGLIFLGLGAKHAMRMRLLGLDQPTPAAEQEPALRQDSEVERYQPRYQR